MSKFCREINAPNHDACRTIALREMVAGDNVGVAEHQAAELKRIVFLSINTDKRD